MADTSKAQKLASAKKRFKELTNQKKNASTNAQQSNETSGNTPIDSMTSSTNSSINNEQNVQEPNTQLPNYFTNTQQQQQPAAFFDHFTLPPTNNAPQVDNGVSYFDSINTPNPTGNSFFDDIPQNPYANPENVRQIEHAFEDYSMFKQNDHKFQQDAETIEDPEIQDNNLFEGNKTKVISDQDTKDLLSYLQRPNPNEITDSIKEENSNMESLRQLSDQMAELIDSNSEYAVSTSITDLEKRNLELAASLEQEKIKSEQLAASLRELQTRNLDLESQLQQKDNGTNMQTAQELSRLKDELQHRIQTMGMLVAENTELSASLSQFELTTKQKTLECEELQARLKTSRSLVADLEREINNMKMEKSRNDNMGKEQTTEKQKLHDDFNQLKEVKEELEQDLLEVREKLKHSTNENLNLQHEVQDLTSKLSLAGIKIQQLTSGESHQVSGEVEHLTNEKFALEKQIASLNQMLKTITKERDESSQQYQQYAEQLNAQVYSFSTKIEQLQQEKEQLVFQEQNRVKHIGDLERQLQSLQNDQVTYATLKNGSDSKIGDLEATKELLVQTQIDCRTIEENFTKVSNEKEMLLKELAAKNESLTHLESMVEQLRGNQPDSVKLLATMESDKVAAARAVAQNKEMKQQMEGMNEVFMKLNNDKVELTEKLAIEQKSNKELFDKLQKTEITLQTLADAIEIKDRELTSLRDSSAQLNKQALHHEQLSDRLRHYEAQGHSSGALQQELQDAKMTISKLNSELKQFKMENDHPHDHHHDHPHDHEHNHEHGHEHHHQKEHINKEINSLDQDFNKDNNDNDEIDKEVAMKYLEDKFTRTMQEIANLQEEKQRLEHLVNQLQTETETIGEYVALYQHQRMVLKQRAVEKDQQLKQLANDREQMKEKLHKLNMLIHKIVNKRKVNDTSDAKNYVIEEENVKELVQENIGENKETAKEIIHLLGEIETSNLIQPNSEDYHPCAMCHGQLLTV